MPAYRPVRQAPVHAPRPDPRWPIPPLPCPSTDSLNSDSDMTLLMTAMVSRTISRPGSQHSSHHSTQTASLHATPERSRPPTPEDEGLVDQLVRLSPQRRKSNYLRHKPANR